MQYAPRTIAFLCELRHPPLPLDPAPIQKLHNSMFESGDPAYRSFQVAAEGATLSNTATQPGAVSSVSFLADRFLYASSYPFISATGYLAWFRTLPIRPEVMDRLLYRNAAAFLNLSD